MKSAATSFRGDVRQTCLKIVPTVYGFDATNDPEKVKANVERLLKDSTFVFSNSLTASLLLLFVCLILIASQRTGKYRHKAFVHVAQALWFRHPSHHGAGPFRSRFNPIRLETFAFMATGVCLSSHYFISFAPLITCSSWSASSKTGAWVIFR